MARERPSPFGSRDAKFSRKRGRGRWLESAAGGTRVDVPAIATASGVAVGKSIVGTIIEAVPDHVLARRRGLLRARRPAVSLHLPGSPAKLPRCDV
jgi:hypothetical protein